MSDRPTIHVELLLLCGKVRDEALTPEDAARLDALLQSSDEAKTLYVQYMSVVSLLESRGASEHRTAGEGEVLDELHQDVLAELLQAERDAEPIVLPQPSFESQAVEAETDRLTWHTIGSATTYLLSRPKVWGSIAAVLALALVLVVVFRPGTTAPPLANTPTNPGSVVVELADAVATLTAQYDAVWDAASAEGALAPGSPLRAGDRLALTHGFAEITTNDGAVAILEAPATIELLNNDNAIRLHAGKLVGICETDASKGFLVRTPHMDITDLGTRFGVEVRDGTTTDAHVFEGEINVSNTGANASPENVILTAGQAVVESNGAGTPSVSNANPLGFAARQGFDAIASSRSQRLTGVHRMEGQLKPIAAAQFLDNEPSSWPSSESVLLFEEFSGTLRSQALADAVQPGQYEDPNAEPATIAPGSRVRSYILIKTKSMNNQAVVTRGSVTFDAEVIGVIHSGKTAALFAEEYRKDVHLFEHTDPGLYQWADLEADTETLTISGDNRTVSFVLKTEDSTDTIRVLVRDDRGQPR